MPSRPDGIEDGSEQLDRADRNRLAGRRQLMGRVGDGCGFLALRQGPGTHPRLARSDDGGETWQLFDVEAATGAFDLDNWRA